MGWPVDRQVLISFININKSKGRLFEPAFCFGRLEMRNTYRPVIPSQLAAVKPAFASAKPALLMHRGSCRCCSPLELIAYPILETIGCSLTEEHQSFTCGDSWVSHFISPLLNLPMLFSNAREFTFGARASFGRGFTIYLFDAIFILALAYPLLILFSRKGGRHLVPPPKADRQRSFPDITRCPVSRRQPTW